jgi:glutathione S-transferase
VLTLHTLAISHYCEKVRWALDFKGVAYREKILVPGFHRLAVRRLSGTSTVPVLVGDDTGRCLTDSTDIVAWLEERVPEPPLYPDDPDERARALEIEDFFDERCGRHVSRYLYHHLLDHPSVLRERWATGLDRAGRVLLRLGLPFLRVGMRRAMEVSAADAVRHRAAIDTACDKLEAWLDSAPGDYLVGARLSVADLAAASLLGPTVPPPGSPWDRSAGGTGTPEGLLELREDLADREAIGWVHRVWKRHRFRARGGPC